MTTKKTKLKDKSETEIMFPDATICGIKVKPWSFGKLFEFSSILDSVIRKIEEDKDMVDEFIKMEVSYFTWVKLFTSAGSEVLSIISMTVDKEIDEIKDLAMKDGIKLATTIFQQNSNTILSSIKNAFGSPPQEENEKEGEQEE